MDTELLLGDINKQTWKNIFKNFEYDDPEVIDFFRENEEKVLDKIFEFSEDIPLLKKRQRYIRELLECNARLEDVSEEKYQLIYNEIESLREGLGISILELENKLGGSTHRVFYLGNKVIKFGKYFEIPNDENILQPEFSLMLENKTNSRMTVFEKIKPFEFGDVEISQIMYNRLREKGILWLDVHADNIGLTTNLIDEDDDGLRVIDAECMESVYKRMEKLRTEKNEYNKYGTLDVCDAFLNYLTIEGGIGRENAYKQAKLNNTLITKYEVKPVAEQTTISGLQRIKSFFTGLFVDKGNERE